MTEEERDRGRAVNKFKSGKYMHNIIYRMMEKVLDVHTFV